MTGKSGNSEATGFGMNLRATLQGPGDRLEFFGRANFEETDGAKSADDARGGVDYANQINDAWNWYVSSEFGRDVIKDTDLFVTTTVGYCYTLPKRRLASSISAAVLVIASKIIMRSSIPIWVA